VERGNFDGHLFFTKNSLMRIFIIMLLGWSSLGLHAQPSRSFSEEIAEYRETYKQEFIEDERAPLKSEEDLANLRFFEPNEKYRVRCIFTRTPDAVPFDLPTYSGVTKPYVKYGELHFDWKGRHTLSVYQSLRLRNMPGYTQHLFLPFNDLTNGDSTYGGGRYIDLTVQDVEAEPVFLDFNHCYNPWCCYSDGYSCPIPPAENKLNIAIEAGEKMYAGGKKH
jgi:uncharacterized protein